MEKHENLLEIRNLVVQYVTEDEVVHAVNDVTLTIPKGKALGLVGETGAGKTTTALSILRLLPKFTGRTAGGEIWFEGNNLLEYTEAQMRKIRGGKISMIFQDPMTSLNPVLTVRDQIAEVLKLHRHDLKGEALDKEIGRLLEMVGIPASRMGDYPHQFSGGMKQRVVIAIAIVLLITHDLGVVASICDYVAIMYAGEIVEYGTLEDIFDPQKKHHPYTEGLFRSIPNIHVESRRLQPIDGLMPEPTDLPYGCKFNPRCPHCTEACRQGEIAVVQAGTHQIKCSLYQEKDLLAEGSAEKEEAK